MARDKGIIEETADTLTGAKDAAKEKVQNATEKVKNVVTEITKEMDETKRNAKKEAEEKARKNLANEKTKMAVEKSFEGAKERFKGPTEGEFQSIDDKGNILKSSRYRLDVIPPFAAPHVQIFESVFEPASSSKIIPIVCASLKKIIK
ncbi:hypothetical protein PVAND_016174 [Polypedilum vanderplanki]|uniref:Uncharacterized protein n=1 Tax=Polypedilum vanderplanki TaxID=319348 RepID=A0A9J6BET7_POLVA|nr:hypothetical protein PVAND_016174 [Polypedilum vanderplanki]